ncbi:MAG: SDR family oxidoreductase [Marinilabiliales bacterium]|nr:MAG: SDR family oxidoreductase [Marinilabiliales bacterium]
MGPDNRLAGKIAVITGATSGIGKETALALAAEGATVVLPVRNLQKGEDIKREITGRTGNPGIDLIECDLASFDSIRSFAENFNKRFDRLHILVNNAGIWEKKFNTTKDGIEMNFGVNHLAPFLLTNVLLGRLKAGAPSRIVNVSSEAHRYTGFNFDDPELTVKYSSLKSYSQSKLANILFTRHLAPMVAKDGITVNCLHPGVVATNLFDKLGSFIRPVAGIFMASPRKGAETSIFLAAGSEPDGETGGYWVKKRKKRPSRAALDDEAARMLWDLSREYTGI